MGERLPNKKRQIFYTVTRKVIVYTLTAEQIAEAKAVGEGRRQRGDDERKRNPGKFKDLQGSKDPDKTPLDNEIEGAACEIALAFVAGVAYMLGKCDYDCVIHGKKVDAKKIGKAYIGCLALRNKRGKDIDIFVVGLGGMPDYTFAFVGWCNYDELMREENLCKRQSGLNYRLSIKDLRPIDTLIPDWPSKMMTIDWWEYE